MHCGTCHEKVVILGLAAQILEDGLFPEPLHMIPVVNLAMTNGVVQSHCLGLCQRFVSNVKVEIFDTTLGGQVVAQEGRLARDAGSTCA